MTKPRRGNPVRRARGQVVRSVLMVRLSEGPVPIADLCGLLRIARVTLCNHLAGMRDRGSIKGYSTANGRVSVWWA